jgi:hypothetical protein
MGLLSSAGQVRVGVVSLAQSQQQVGILLVFFVEQQE